MEDTKLYIFEAFSENLNFTSLSSIQESTIYVVEGLPLLQIQQCIHTYLIKKMKLKTQTSVLAPSSGGAAKLSVEIQGVECDTLWNVAMTLTVKLWRRNPIILDTR